MAWGTIRKATDADKAKLEAAVAFAVAHENPNTKDLAVAIVNQFRNEAPYNTLIGPTQPRAGANGLVVHKGAIVAEWGDTTRADMAFSVTKTFLSTVAGVAFDRKQIRDVSDRVAPYMPEGVDLFTSEHNAAITWEHLLRQTSDWQGTLWGKPDWADRPEGERPADWPNRKLSEPGTRYKYNDVRVNLLALAALHVIRRPLPEVLRYDGLCTFGANGPEFAAAVDAALARDSREARRARSRAMEQETWECRIEALSAHVERVQAKGRGTAQRGTMTTSPPA